MIMCRVHILTAVTAATTSMAMTLFTKAHTKMAAYLLERADGVRVVQLYGVQLTRVEEIARLQIKLRNNMILKSGKQVL